MTARRLAPALAALALAVTAAGVVAAPGSGVPSSSTAPTAARAAAKAPVVGSVAKLGGTKNLKVQAAGTRKLKPIKAGGKLRLGDRLTLGRGVTATLKLTRPKAVAEGTRLVEVVSATGTTHRSKVSRKGKTTTVAITPVKATK